MDIFLVHYCDNFPTGYNFDSIFILQTQETSNTNSQSDFTHVKEVAAVMQKEINSECRTLAYISLVLTILALVMVAILHYRKAKFCRGCTISNAVKIMVFISDVQNYISIKVFKTAGSIHLFKIAGMLKVENIKLKIQITYETY